MDGRLYLRSIAKRWKREAHAKVERMIFLSPYITGTAEFVLGELRDGGAEIYTTFSAETFLSGASSLKALKTCLRSGHALYALPKLHAKMMLVPGQFASIGSQNLTRGGTVNKESSV